MSLEESKQSRAEKVPPPRPPPPRASTIDCSAGGRGNPMLRDAQAAMAAAAEEGKGRRKASLENGGGGDQQQQQEQKGQEGEEEEEAPSRWRSIWETTSSTVQSASSSVTQAVVTAKDATVAAAVTAKDATVNAAVSAKDATVNAAVSAKDATVSAAVKTKDVTVSAAVKTKEATVAAAVTAKDATVHAAVTAKDATVNATVSAKDATVNAAASAAATTTNTLASVVVLAKKAAKDTKHRVGPAADSITLVHFNDVYNVEPRGPEQEPVAGAARFVTAVNTFDHLSPMILFSGDVFAPSIMSTFTKGEQMIPVLNKLGVHCACFGNHDFDFGIDVLMEHAEKTTFPWLMSNVIDNETGRPLAEGKVSHTLDWWGRKIGLIGLVEKEWLDTLATINPSEVTYTDYVTAGSMLAKELRAKGCEYVIALTHMRTPNDVRLAESVGEIDLILGGHDHVYEKKMVNGKYILKSGTDFRQFSVITVNFVSATASAPASTQVEIEAVEVSSKFEEDAELAALLEKYTDRMDAEMCKELGEFECDLDGRFSSTRTGETNLGNFICDIMVAATNADLAILNSGTLRSDTVHPAGPFFLKDLLTILPMIDPLVLLEVTGEQVLACLENGVSQYPKLEGRFPQVSGVSFAFDPRRAQQQRVDQRFVRIGDEYLEKGRTYRLVTKAYLADGKDGYDCLAEAKRLIDDENGPTLTYAVQNHFKAIAMREGKTRKATVHHQSLVTMSRRTCIVRQLTEEGTQPIPAHLPAKFKGSQSVDLSEKLGRLKKASTISDLEETALKPKIKGRIKIMTPELLLKLEKRKELCLRGDFILEEEDDEQEEQDAKKSAAPVWEDLT